MVSRIPPEISSDRGRGDERFSSEIAPEMLRRLVYHAFQREIELDYITVSRLFLVPVT